MDFDTILLVFIFFVSIASLYSSAYNSGRISVLQHMDMSATDEENEEQVTAHTMSAGS